MFKPKPLSSHGTLLGTRSLKKSLLAATRERTAARQVKQREPGLRDGLGRSAEASHSGDAPNCKRELSDSAREELDRDSVFGFILRLLARVLT